jgi:hypothetical protein
MALPFPPIGPGAKNAAVTTRSEKQESKPESGRLAIALLGGKAALMARRGLYKIEHCRGFPQPASKGQALPGAWNFHGWL